MSIGSILLIVAVVCFLLVGFGVALGTVNLTGIGLAAFAGAFLFGGGGINLRR